MDGMLAAGKAAEHRPRLGEIRRFVQGSVAQGDGGIGPEDQSRRELPRDGQGLETRIVQDHHSRISRGVLMLGDRRDFDRMR